mgnify:FL=1|jgi:hypothetical protein
MFIIWRLLLAILLSTVGNSFYKWFCKTKMGIWFDKKMEKIMSTVTKKVEHLEIQDDNENGSSPPRKSNKL